MKRLTFGSYRNFWPELAVLMMSFYILADMFSGFTIIYLGIDVKASLIYKVPLLILILALIARNNAHIFNLLLFLIILMFIGPFFQFMEHARSDFFIADFSTALKILTPICVFFLFKLWYQNIPEFALASTHKILTYCFVLLSINFTLGALGFGQSTYDFGDDGTVGTTGFMMAGNELGGAFLVAYTYMLHRVWNRNSRWIYLILAVFTVFCGVTVSTKTTILAAIIIVCFVPIVNERKKLYKLTLLKMKILIPIVVLMIAIIILLIDILQSLGLYDRFLWLYNKGGLLGMLLSGREVMVVQNIELLLQKSTLIEQLLGQGEAMSLKRVDGSATTEVDGVDTFIFFGVFTFLFVLSFYIYTLYKAHQQTISGVNFFSPFVFLAGFILLMLSQMSGHIWGSGTVGVLMGVMLGSLHNAGELEPRSI